MRRALVCVFAALCLAAPAGAAVPTAVDGDGGGTPSCCTVWIEVVWTYWDGYPHYLYCRYASDGNVVWQLDCWS